MENKQELSLPDNKAQLPGMAEKKVSEEKWKKGSRLLSALVGSNILLFSSTLVTCVFATDADIWETDMLIFLCIVMVICMSWMVFQIYFSWKNKNAILHTDCQAGPIWMRGGIILFGAGTLIMTVLRIVHASDYLGCETPMKLVYSVIQSGFVVVQTYFLWVSCKHCVQIYMNATRCGLMVLLSINLTLWLIAVTEESGYHAIEIERYLEGNVTQNHTTPAEGPSPRSHNCSCKSICKFIPTEYYYLYPFNIEYNLFASAMIYIMWKNVGRRIDDNDSHHYGLGPGVRKHIPLFGLFLGMAELVTGLVMFILYEVGKTNTVKYTLSLTTFYFFHVVSLGLMSIANLVGIIFFQLDKRSMDNEKNPSRTLDMALLVGATMAQYGLSYYSIIAMVASTPFTLLSSLTLVCSLLTIIQHSLQNVFIIEGLHRLPPSHLVTSRTRKDAPKKAQLPSDTQKVDSQETGSPHSVPAAPDHPPDRRMSRRATLTAQLKSHLKKRKTLKDIYLFLFLSNLIFWIMPAFGARIMFDTGLEVEFYGFTLWTVITNMCLPFGIFYRMHAAASLLELYSIS
ncbi:hypothetical protein GDO86_013972 [Hymenochirus boettgeri]|uniref:Otopetrin 2 n=1 Tax=Hymenochirus boettgeri TaxID=247094 RepID=A0A8T2JMA9_9PIPI|nr:hypothetical protein GDO86_013972 [Hymenochirus boettgeri]